MKRRAYLPIILATFLSACGGGASSTTPPAAQAALVHPPATPGTASALGITFSSDRSLILPIGGKGVLSASGPNGAAATWSSQNPTIATVDASGNVHAISKGISTVTVTAGGSTDIATVIVGETSPNTVVVASSDVISNDGTQVTMNTSAAGGITVGKLVVSGDRGGLLGSVTAVQNQGTTTALTINAATLADVFPNASFDITGAQQSATLTSERGALSTQLPNGTRQTLSSSALSCSDSSKIDETTVTTPDSSLSWDITVAPHLIWETSDGTLQQFQLSEKLAASAQFVTGDIKIQTASNFSFTCKTAGALIPVPIIALGPVIVNLTASGEYGIVGNASATGTIDLPGPAFSASLQNEAGIAFADGTWSTIDDGAPSGTVSLPSPASPFTDSFKANGFAQPYASAHFGASIALGSKYVKLVAAQFLTPRIYGKMDFSLDGSVSPTTGLTYSGPVWDGKVGSDLTFDPALSGAIPSLLKLFGVTFAFTPASIAAADIPLAGSPVTTLSAAGSCNVTLTDTISDANAFPINYTGDKVDFYALSSPSGGATGKLATTTVTGSTGAQLASTQWNAPSDVTGVYKVTALVYDGFFGVVGLPYASGPQSVPVTCSSPPPTPAPTPTPLPAPCDTALAGVDSSNTPYACIPAGKSGVIEDIIYPLSPTDSPVNPLTLYPGALPAGVTLAFSSGVVSLYQPFDVTVTVAGNVAPGTYPLAPYSIDAGGTRNTQLATLYVLDANTLLATQSTRKAQWNLKAGARI